MKIQVVTDVVTRRAGGVFDAVRDMFTNKVFSDHDVEILSYEDDMIEGTIKILVKNDYSVNPYEVADMLGIEL